ncbi:MAG: hypothetical protein CMN04_02950 [Roseibacillus sp.]|nr:hypothetical protein [Roseibacillus sp.]
MVSPARTITTEIATNNSIAVNPERWVARVVNRLVVFMDFDQCALLPECVMGGKVADREFV